MIENKLDLEWVCDTRVDLVNDELLSLMSKAGCKTIWFGVESASQKILQRIGRNTTPQEVEKAFIAYPDSRLYNELLEKGNYVKLDEFLLSVKTEEFDYDSLMMVQRRFFK